MCCGDGTMKSSIIKGAWQCAPTPNPMRIIEIIGTNMELTEAIRSYVEEKLGTLVKMTEKYSPCDVAVDVGKTSTHHAKGDVWKAELMLTIPGGTLRAESVKDDLYAAIDDANDELKRQLVERKERAQQ